MAFGGFGSTTGGFGSTFRSPSSSSTSMFGSSTSAASTGTNLNPNNHYLIPEQDGPQDTIQRLKWSPTQDVLLSASWDGCVRVYQVQGGRMQQNSHQLKLTNNYQQANPAKTTVPMDVSFRHDGMGYFTACADGKVYWVDFNSPNSIQQCGSHNAPVRSVSWMQQANNGSGLLVSGGMDNALKFWDVRTSLNNPNAQPAFSLNLPDRVASMDVCFPVCGVLTANRGIYIYDFSNITNYMQPAKIMKGIDAPMKRQFRSIAVSPDKTCFAIGSTEGRVSVQYIQPALQSKTFAFRCHRDKDKNLIYPVNDLAFHPKYFTFATIGGDGKYNIWDKENKLRLEDGKDIVVQSSNGPQPLSLTAGAFSAQGDKFAYAAGYDWSMGISGKQRLGANAKSYLFIKFDCDESAKPKRT